MIRIRGTGSVGEGVSVSWNDLIECYIRERTPSTATIANMRQIVRRFATDTGFSGPLEVDREHILYWRDQVIARASAITWNNYHSHLRALFNAAVEADLLPANPWSAVRSVTTYQRQKKTVPPELVSRLVLMLEAPDSRLRPGWFWAATLKTLFYTGMRRRQLVHLRWSHVDLGTNTILLDAAGSKTRREWTIPIATQLRPTLVDLYRRTIDTAGHIYISGDGQVFNATLWYSRYLGDEMTVEQLSGAYRRLSDWASRALGCPVVLTPHRLRHTMATLLAARDLKSVQHMLGHTDVRTTLEYVTPEIGPMRSLVEQLPEM